MIGVLPVAVTSSISILACPNRRHAWLNKIGLGCWQPKPIIAIALLEKQATVTKGIPSVTALFADGSIVRNIQQYCSRYSGGWTGRCAAKRPAKNGAILEPTRHMTPR